MAKFFVGQRVRLVRPWAGSLTQASRRTWAVLEGAEGVVTHPTIENMDDEQGVGVNVAGAVWVMPDYGIEPILPEGAAPSEFSTLTDLLASLEVTA